MSLLSLVSVGKGFSVATLVGNSGRSVSVDGPVELGRKRARTRTSCLLTLGDLGLLCGRCTDVNRGLGNARACVSHSVRFVDGAVRRGNMCCPTDVGGILQMNP